MTSHVHRGSIKLGQVEEAAAKRLFDAVTAESRLLPLDLSPRTANPPSRTSCASIRYEPEFSRHNPHLVIGETATRRDYERPPIDDSDRVVSRTAPRGPKCDVLSPARAASLLAESNELAESLSRSPTATAAKHGRL